MPSIIELPSIIAGLKEDEKELFNRFFMVEKSIGHLRLADKMKPWARKAFGSVENVENQVIIKILNKHTFEMALFNELRAKRPIDVKSDEDSIKIINENAIDDHFCKPELWTPSDSFGRIKSKRCLTASNVAKYDQLHGLVIFKKHNPLDFSEKELQDYFRTAMKWFDKAFRTNRNAVYPFLLWNCLWKAGASIIHGHMQLVLGEGVHYAEAELYNKLRKEYSVKYNSNYFLDFYKAHEIIGLGSKARNMLVFTSLTPKKDKEVTIISEKLDKKCVKIIYQVSNCLVKELGVDSFNLGVILPPLGKDEKGDGWRASWKGFPVIARIVSRGSLSNKTSDIGGMEMFANSRVIETDPYKVFEKIRTHF